jgi:alpha-beta hydrolase superfamily lysophospholipase
VNIQKFLCSGLCWAGIVLAAALAAGCSPLVNSPGQAVSPAQLKRAHFVTADRVVLPVRSWMPADGQVQNVIVALHGFNDYSKFFSMPAAYLSAQGVACYAYDQRGFGHAPGRGLWSGIEAYTRDLAEFTDAVRRRHPGVPVYVLGESMGGAVAIVAMTGKQPPAADGLILSAPAVWSRDTMPWYQRLLLGAGARTVPWMELTGEGLGILPSDNIEMLRALGRDPLVIKGTRIDAMYGLVDLMDAAMEQSGRLRPDTLVLYGDRDQVVPKEPVYRMLRGLPKEAPVRAAFYAQGYHMLLRDLHAEATWRDIAAWLRDRKAPLPSGADRHIPQELRDALPLTARAPQTPAGGA